MKYTIIITILFFQAVSPLFAQSLATQTIGSTGFSGPAGTSNKLYWNVGEVVVGLGINGSQLNQGFFQYFDITTALRDPHYQGNLLTTWPNPAIDIIYIKSNQQDRFSLFILDANGKIIMHSNDLNPSETNEINIAHLPSAQYYLLASKSESEKQLIKFQVCR